MSNVHRRTLVHHGKWPELWALNKRVLKAVAAKRPYALIASVLMVPIGLHSQTCAIDLGPDQTICQGQTVTLNAPAGFPNYLWSTGSTATSITVGTAGTYWGQVSYPSPQLFPNSNFSAGNTGFSSGFNYSTTLTTDGNYYIGTNANTYHGQFFGTGTGNFMIVNSGWPSALWNIYCQDVVVCPGQTYTLSYRARSVSNATPARLQWWINGSPVGPEVNLPAFNAGWQTISQTWTSGAAETNASICLRVMSGEGVGNDFGLDDITMQGTIVLRDDVTVNVTPLPAFDLGPNTTLCAGQALVLDATVPGGTYLWQDGATTPTYTVSAPGVYSVNVTANGCSATDAISVNYTPLPVVDLGPDLTLCTGQTRVLNASTPGASYAWQNGSTLPTFNVIGPGNYSVQVTVNGCTTTDAVNVGYNTTPVIDLGPDQVACEGTTVTLDGTTPGATYLWSDGTGGATLDVTGNSTASVTVTVSGCSASDAVNVNFTPLPIVDLGPDRTVCPGTPVQLDATVPGGSYAWQDGSNLPTFNASIPGVYTVTVTANNCQSSDAFTLSNFALQTVDLGPDLSICQGQGTTIGTVVPGATYLWNTGAVTNSIGISAAGTYWLDVTLNGCTVRDEINVSVIPLPVLNLGVDRSICPGTTVLLDATVAGASYLWNTGATTPTLDAPPGNYTVTVTANGCSRNDAIALNPWPAPVLDLGPDVTLCPGTVLDLDAAQPGASYLWQDGSTGSSFTVPGGGTYTVQLTDANGCVITDAITVSYDAPTPVDLGPDFDLCQGGQAVLDASVAGATYQWSNGATTPTITAGTTGSYSVVVTQGQCAVSDVVNVQVNPLPSVELGNDVVLCPGETAVLNAGGPGLTYAWNTGSVSPSITVVADGTYSVTVTDQSNCTATDAVSVSYSTPGSVDLGPDLDLCQGESATLNATLPGATYLWNTGAATATLDVNASGTYAVMVTQGNCQVTDAVEVVVNPAPQVELGNDAVLCAGENILLDATWPGATYAWNTGANTATIAAAGTGIYTVNVDLDGCTATDAIEVTVLSTSAVEIGPDATICAGEAFTLDATTPGATYLWNTGATTPTIEVTGSGTYTVEVFSGLCSVTDQATITVNPAPQVELGNDAVLCAGEDIVLDATWPGATYAWNTGASTATITAAGTGIYTVNVDLDGCTATDAIEVTVLSTSAVEIGPNAAICAGEAFTLDATTPGATYLWNTGATTPTIEVTGSGTYTVEVFSGLCSVTDQATITVNPAPQVELGADMVLCNGEQTVMLDASWPGATYAWSTGESSATIEVQADGVYSVQASLGNCSVTDVVEVSFGTLNYDLGPDVTLCPNEVLTLGAGLPAGTATWNSATVAPTFTVDAPGTATLLFVGTNGCSVRDTITVAYASTSGLDLGPDLALCEGDVAELDALLPGAAYLWNDGLTEGVRTVSVAGTYSVEVFVGSCSVTDQITVTYTPLPLVDLGPDRSICPDEVAVFDATMPGATYLWNDGSTGPVLERSTPGTVVVSVQLDGCSATDEADVIMLNAPDLSLGNDTTLCQDASLLLDITGPNTTYLWDDGSTAPQRLVAQEGIIWVEATMNSCIVRDSIVVDMFSPSTYALGPDLSICSGSTVEIGVPVDGATYLWNTGATTPTIAAGVGGTYTATVMVGGCTAQDEVDITVVVVTPPDLGPDIDRCQGEPVVLTASGSTISWSTGAAGNSITVTSTGLYTATVDSAGCAASDMVLINFRPLITEVDLGADRSLCAETLDMIQASPIPGASYTWNDGRSGPFITIDAPGVYSVHATGTCIDATDSVTVIAEDCSTTIHVPNAFTPNDDGINDRFVPYLEGAADAFTMDIFDRWGQRIHTTDDRNAGWDGTSNGLPVADGVYVWTVTYRVPAAQGSRRERRVGHVTLLR